MDNVTPFNPPPPRPKAGPDTPPEQRATNFAFRLSLEMKAAAKALVKVHLKRPNRNGKLDFVNSVYAHSINDVLVTLVTIGLEQMASIVPANLEKETEELKAFAEMLAFFLANPSTDVAVAEDFPTGSPARRIIEVDAAICAEDPDSYEVQVWDHGYVASSYAFSRDRVASLTDAIEAIQQALTR